MPEYLNGSENSNYQDALLEKEAMSYPTEEKSDKSYKGFYFVWILIFLVVKFAFFSSFNAPSTTYPNTSSSNYTISSVTSAPRDANVMKVMENMVHEKYDHINPTQSFIDAETIYVYDKYIPFVEEKLETKLSDSQKMSMTMMIGYTPSIDQKLKYMELYIPSAEFQKANALTEYKALYLK